MTLLTVAFQGNRTTIVVLFTSDDIERPQAALLWSIEAVFPKIIHRRLFIICPLVSVKVRFKFVSVSEL